MQQPPKGRIAGKGAVARRICVLLFPIFLCSCAIVSPDDLFAQGRFDGAKALYEEQLAENSNDAPTLKQLARIALYENRFKDCEKFAKGCLQIDKQNVAAKTVLQECYYRQDRFKDSIPLLRELGRNDDADLLDLLSKKPAYQTPTGFKMEQIPFTQLDPLPTVQVSVNGGPPLRFFIDTGAAEVYLDSNLANSMGLKLIGTSTGTFAGGKRASLRKTLIDSLSFGGLTVKNVPSIVIDLSKLGSIMGGKVDGCIGTVFLYHFLSTIDYSHKRLVLRLKGSRLEEHGQTVSVPFWMWNDHFLFAWAHLNSAPEHLFLIDTGLAGAAVDASKGTLEEAKVTLDPTWSGTGVGGGGEVHVTNFWVDAVSMGSVSGHHLLGDYDGTFDSAKMFPFEVAGLISHTFFRPFELTFDFQKMRLLITDPS